MKISFTKRTQKNYDSTRVYISEKWGKGTVKAFEQKMIDFSDFLKWEALNFQQNKFVGFN